MSSASASVDFAALYKYWFYFIFKIQTQGEKYAKKIRKMRTE